MIDKDLREALVDNEPDEDARREKEKRLQQYEVAVKEDLRKLREQFPDWPWKPE